MIVEVQLPSSLDQESLGFECLLRKRGAGKTRITRVSREFEW